MAMNISKIYLNGAVLDEADPAARISIHDAGFLHGASAFTTMMSRNGVVFRLGRHLSRLLETAALLGFRGDATAESLTAGVYAALDANKLANARLRVTLTPGAIHGGRAGDRAYRQAGADDDAPLPTTLITAEPLPARPAGWDAKGIGVVVSSLHQQVGDPTFGRKTGCYFQRVLARQEAASKGADEAIWFTTTNYLAEACFSNVFIVLGGKVLTPPTDTPVLPGIVRQAVLEICREHDIDFDDQTPLTIRELLAAEEMFLTNSTTGVRPVAWIERHEVADGQPGDLTRTIRQHYEALVDAECAAGRGGKEQAR